MRGRTEPDDEGRADDEEPLLLAEDEDDVPEALAVLVGLLPEEGLAVVDGLPLEDGLAVVEGELADGVEGLDAGGGVACANGAPPPPERL